MKRTIFLLVLACMFGTMSAQITNISSDKRQFDADSVIEEFDKLPFFGPFKDTYFTVQGHLFHGGLATEREAQRI